VLLSILVAGTVVIPLSRPGYGQPAVLPFVVIAVVVAWLWYAPRITAQRAVATSKLLQSPVRGIADDKGLKLTTENGSADLPWAVFHRARVGSDVVMLYQSAYIYNMFPRSWFGSDAEWAAFKQMAATKAPQPGKGLGQLGWTLLLVLLVFLVTLVAAFLRQ
jgi:hypothetical protein